MTYLRYNYDNRINNKSNLLFATTVDVTAAGGLRSVEIS